MKIFTPKKSAVLVIFLLCVLGIPAIIMKMAYAYGPSTISIESHTVPASPADWHVVSSPAGIDCTGGTGVCSFDFDYGTEVTLTATPPTDRLLDYWQVPNDCHGSSQVAQYQNSCTFTASQSEAIKLYWIYSTYTISVATKGSGSGTITSSAGGLNCPGNCSHTYTGTDVITLTATAAAGSKFAGWGTEAEGGGTCWINGAGGGPPTVRSYESSCRFGVSLLHDSRSYTAAVAYFDKTSTTTTTPSTSTSQNTTTSTPATPTAPTLSEVAVNGQAISAEDTEPMSFSGNKVITVSGKTVPGGVVNLYIFSDPKTAKVTADAQGVWSYAISGLAAGSHHVEYTVTDPKTNTTSERTQLLAFTLTGAKHADTAASAVKKSSGSGVLLWLLVGGGVLILVGAGFGWWWFKKRKAGHIAPPKTGIFS